MIIHYKYLKWIEELGSNCCEGLVDFGKKHMDVYKVTNITKYRSSQYRLLQRALVTNIHLYKWGMSTSDLCFFCNSKRETVLHIMYECDKSKKLWEQVVEYLQARFGQQIEFNPGSVIFNRLVPRAQSPINFHMSCDKTIYIQTKVYEPTLSLFYSRAALE